MTILQIVWILLQCVALFAVPIALGHFLERRFPPPHTGPGLRDVWDTPIFGRRRPPFGRPRR